MSRPEPRNPDAPTGPPAPSRPSDVAIVGMSAILPGAPDVRTFWENTLRGRDAIVEVPPDRWDWRAYYDPDPKAPDKVISKWGGFVPDVPFDPLRYGMPPSSLPSIEPVQLLLLEATRAAILDAGYADRPFDRERTAVVLGMGGGAAQLAMGYAFRSYLPMLDAVAPEAARDARVACQGLLPEWTEDSFPGFLLNVAAGRVANRFDLGGANYTVDAACGSSLAAASLAVRELESGSADVVLLGGADTVQNPFTYLAFSKTHAFSPRGRCRPFDASADGIVISEGVAMVVLKRLLDAERDGDRVYAVIKGMGASSDGRARGLTAPGPEGQARALRRAYEKAGVHPSTVGYVEAHGTGTAVGDVVEVDAIAGLYRESGVLEGATAIGSVKSMIGHTKCAAGLAGLINASLALHHKVLPPTIGVEKLNPKADLAGGPFHVSTEARPWIHDRPDRPRRAAVSAFGFGGTNFHAVLEGHHAGPALPEAPAREWPAELFAWRSVDRAGLLADLDRLIGALEAGATPAIRDLARAVAGANPPRPDSGPTLAIVAASLDDLRGKLKSSRSAIGAGAGSLDDPRGVAFEEAPPHFGEPVAFLFPGQGSQSVGMLGDLARAFPEVRGAFDDLDAALVADGRPRVGPVVFPPPAFDDATRDRQAAALRATEAAQPALGAASVGILRLLGGLGVVPGLVGGHSFGELVALHAAGALPVEGLATLAHERGRLMARALGAEPGAMAAISAGGDEVAGLLRGIDGVAAANLNGPGQTVVAGPLAGVEAAIGRAESSGFRAKLLPVAGAFHSPGMAGASRPLAEAASSRLVGPPAVPAYSNLDARPHPDDPGAIARRLGEHLASPVQFAPMVRAMHDDGARVFVEVGPGSVLAPLVASTLAGRPHRAVSCDIAGRAGIPAFLHALARLVAAGVPARVDRLSRGRSDRTLDLARLAAGDGLPPLPPTTWLVNGSRARPIGQPEPRRLGQAGLTPKAPPPSAPRADRNGASHAHPSKDAPRNGKIMDTPPAPKAPLAPADDRVILAFQETMRAFLDVQRSTMLAYLAGRPAPAPAPAVAPRTASPLPDPLAERIAFQAAVPPAPTPAVARPHPPERRPVPEPGPDAVPTPAAGAVGREAVAARLLEIVRDRTGYPPEMLELDLDLEADLGIDSIKRVEILGTLRDSVPALGESTDPSTMEALSRARTLGAIVDRVAGLASRPGPARQPEDAAIASRSPENPSRRLVLEAVDAPLGEGRDGLEPGGLVVVTDDGRGVARAVAEGFREAGHPVELASPGEVDFTSAGSVEGFLAGARGEGRLAGIVHALPLRDAPPAGLDASRWAGRMGPEVEGLFLLAKAAASDLERASRGGGGALVAATSMGGAFGSLGGDLDFFPGHGGVAGLVKTLAREWPGVRARVVDFHPRAGSSEVAGRIVAEALADDDWSEVGYREGRRVRLRSVASPLVLGSVPRIELAPGEPVVVTGGARGITAALVAELARRWRPTLLVVGQGPLPDGPEPLETASIASPVELKAVLHARLRREGRAVTPGDLERAYRATLRAREIRANLEAFRAAGSVVDYARADVRDPAALGPALDRWRKRFGEPVGLVHGAGVIQDKLIRDKSPASFDHVLGTKLDGAVNLAGMLRPESVRFAALFSSIAGRFGNLGQSDYAAANEALSKLALWLDRRWPGRVVSMIWGPWSGVGMVSDLEGHLGSRGLGMIPPDPGRSLLLDELALGRKGEVEVIVAGSLGTLEAPTARRGLAGAWR